MKTCRKSTVTLKYNVSVAEQVQNSHSANNTKVVGLVIWKHFVE